MWVLIYFTGWWNSGMNDDKVSPKARAWVWGKQYFNIPFIDSILTWKQSLILGVGNLVFFNDDLESYWDVADAHAWFPTLLRSISVTLVLRALGSCHCLTIPYSCTCSRKDRQSNIHSEKLNFGSLHGPSTKSPEDCGYRKDTGLLFWAFSWQMLLSLLS